MTSFQLPSFAFFLDAESACPSFWVNLVFGPVFAAVLLFEHFYWFRDFVMSRFENKCKLPCVFFDVLSLMWRRMRNMNILQHVFIDELYIRIY